MSYLQGARFGWFGNSQSAYSYGLPPWPDNTINLLKREGYECDLFNTSVDAQTTAAIVQKMGPDLAANHIVGRNNIAVVQEGTNHLYYLDIGETNRLTIAHQEIRNACHTLRSAGYLTIVTGSVPRLNGYLTAGNTAQYQADMLTLDRMIEGSYSEYADLFWDIRAAVPEYDPSNTLYSSDTVHQTQHGHAIFASRFVNFLINKIG